MRSFVLPILIVLCTVLTGGPTAAASLTPPPFKALFDLRKGPVTLGEARLTFTQPVPDRYRYRLHTYPVGIARMFYDSEVREVSEGRITGDGFRPDRYEYVRSGDKERHAELRFDWSEGRVVNDVEDKPWSMDIPADAMDRVVGPLQLMRDLAADRSPPLVYRIADGGRLKTYHLSVEGRETVRTPVGRFETVLVVRRSEDGERVTRLWCAPELNYLAVRVRQEDEDDGSFDMVLSRLEGMELPEGMRDGKDSGNRFGEPAMN